jgi:hypothetical protein
VWNVFKNETLALLGLDFFITNHGFSVAGVDIKNAVLAGSFDTH